MKKRTKNILLALAAVLLLIQFIRPARNLSGAQPHPVSVRYPLSPQVYEALKEACYDCHSNLTTYPWYANVQPAAWWLAGHIRNGKKELNFSDFTHLPVAVQNHKLEEIIEVLNEETMPLKSYTWLHPKAVLNDTQQQALADWAQAGMDTLEARYPPDSLVLRRRSEGK